MVLEALLSKACVELLKLTMNFNLTDIFLGEPHHELEPNTLMQRWESECGGVFRSWSFSKISEGG